MTYTQNWTLVCQFHLHSFGVHGILPNVPDSRGEHSACPEATHSYMGKMGVWTDTENAVAPATLLPQTGKCHFAGREIWFTVITRDQKIIRLGWAKGWKGCWVQESVLTYSSTTPKMPWLLRCETQREGSAEEKEHGWAWQIKPQFLFSEPTIYRKRTKNAGNVLYFLMKDSELPMWNKVAHTLVNYLPNVSAKWKKERSTNWVQL